MQWLRPRSCAGLHVRGQAPNRRGTQLSAALLHSGSHVIFRPRAFRGSKFSRIRPSAPSKTSYASLMNVRTKARDTILF